MKRNLAFLMCLGTIEALTCYNGMKLLRMQSVGTTTEDCPSANYCYNMTTSAMLVVDAVKAGCSTYRCMLVGNGCISTYVQLIPVSLCCCSSDRCNVGENVRNDPNWRPAASITGGGDSGSGSGSSNWETSWSKKESTTPTTHKPWSQKEVDDHFRDFDIDRRQGNGGDGIEEEFKKVDAWTTTPPPRGIRPTTQKPSISRQPSQTSGDEVVIP